MLATPEYNDICAYIHNYPDLSMECETALRQTFPHIAPATLDSILAKEWQQQIKLNYPRIAKSARRFLQE